ncbi:MAG: hypothetical protein NW217_03240 [Hyphomicrobiaceae bacterium]|nr:hypothetical protein [Hyphomicrobiaceae bacterium]
MFESSCVSEVRVVKAADAGTTCRDHTLAARRRERHSSLSAPVLSNPAPSATPAMGDAAAPSDLAASLHGPSTGDSEQTSFPVATDPTARALQQAALDEARDLLT